MFYILTTNNERQKTMIYIENFFYLFLFCIAIIVLAKTIHNRKQERLNKLSDDLWQSIKNKKDEENKK